MLSLRGCLISGQFLDQSGEDPARIFCGIPGSDGFIAPGTRRIGGPEVSRETADVDCKSHGITGRGNPPAKSFDERSAGSRPADPDDRPAGACVVDEFRREEGARFRFGWGDDEQPVCCPHQSEAFKIIDGWIEVHQSRRKLGHVRARLMVSEELETEPVREIRPFSDEQSQRVAQIRMGP